MLKTNKKINPKFANWSMPVKAIQKDEITSTPWHLKLDKCLYIPTYMNEPENMQYIMSGEYQRLWHEGRYEWVDALTKKKTKDIIKNERDKRIRDRINAENKVAMEKVQQWKKEKAIKKAEVDRKQNAKLTRIPPETDRKRMCLNYNDKKVGNKNSDKNELDCDVKIVDKEEYTFTEVPEPDNNILIYECHNVDNPGESTEVQTVHPN